MFWTILELSRLAHEKHAIGREVPVLVLPSRNH